MRSRSPVARWWSRHSARPGSISSSPAATPSPSKKRGRNGCRSTIPALSTRSPPGSSSSVRGRRGRHRRRRSDVVAVRRGEAGIGARRRGRGHGARLGDAGPAPLEGRGERPVIALDDRRLPPRRPSELVRSGPAARRRGDERGVPHPSREGRAWRATVTGPAVERVQDLHRRRRQLRRDAAEHGRHESGRELHQQARSRARDGEDLRQPRPHGRWRAPVGVGRTPRVEHELLEPRARRHAERPRQPSGAEEHDERLVDGLGHGSPLHVGRCSGASGSASDRHGWIAAEVVRDLPSHGVGQLGLEIGRGRCPTRRSPDVRRTGERRPGRPARSADSSAGDSTSAHTPGRRRWRARPSDSVPCSSTSRIWRRIVIVAVPAIGSAVAPGDVDDLVRASRCSPSR